MTERERLVEEHLGLVEGIAGKLKRTIGRSIPFDDLVGYGNKGLVEAAARYDARQGVTFRTFAYYRIRGAMLDGLRTMGWYSRSDYARHRAEERANELLSNAAERQAAARAATGAGAARDGADPAAALAEIEDLLSQVGTIHIASLDAAANLADERLPPPDAGLTSADRSARLRAAVNALPDTERRLMELYYFQDKTLEEAGGVLGLSKSWSCRLHARAVSLLREQLEREGV
jgi:RNA polymerase sigma factor for flagellar operon FliA